jgi:Rieske Fe-S protein
MVSGPDLKKQNNMEQPVRIFKCPCRGNKYKLAGKPNDNPTLKEKWEWCDKHL